MREFDRAKLLRLLGKERGEYVSALQEAVRRKVAEEPGAIDEIKGRAFNVLREAWGGADDFIQDLFWVKSTTPGRLVRLRYNSAQRRLAKLVRDADAKKQPVRVVILKARQVGFSTLIQAMMAERFLTEAHFRSAVVAHDKGPMQEIFEMTSRFMGNLPVVPPLKTDRREEYQTRFDSKYTALTAGNEDVGHALSCHAVHLSEFSRYPNAEPLYDGLMQTIHQKPGTWAFIESTANGMANLFRDLWVDAEEGRSDWTPLFIPWFEHEDKTRKLTDEGRNKLLDTLDAEESWLQKKFEVTLEQLAWRRWCIRNNCRNQLDIFHEQYPSYPDEAFLSSGRPVFDQKRIQELHREVEEPLAVGDLAWTE